MIVSSRSFVESPGFDAIRDVPKVVAYVEDPSRFIPGIYLSVSSFPIVGVAIFGVSPIIGGLNELKVPNNE